MEKEREREGEGAPLGPGIDGIHRTEGGKGTFWLRGEARRVDVDEMEDAERKKDWTDGQLEDCLNAMRRGWHERGEGDRGNGWRKAVRAREVRRKCVNR